MKKNNIMFYLVFLLQQAFVLSMCTAGLLGFDHKNFLGSNLGRNAYDACVVL